MKNAARLKQCIAGKYDHEVSVFLFWKGRVGLYSILRAMDVGPGSEVIIPAFTCVVVSNAVLYLGARPVYVDIDTKTLNTTLDRIKAARTVNTKAVVCQNTFGLSSEVDDISDWAASEQILSVEDCTHGFGGSFKGRPNGSYCDAAFFSSQWNKPISSGIGGFIVARNAESTKGLKQLESQLGRPSYSEVLGLRGQVWARRNLLTDGTYWTLLKIYRWLSSKGIITGSSSGGEISGTTMPNDYFKAMSEFQAHTVFQEVARLERYNEERRSAANLYTEFLSANDKYHVDKALDENHMFLKYPVLVRDRASFMRIAEQEKIELGDWFNSPLHPVQGDLSAWGLNPDYFPNASHVASHIVNLPTRSDTDKVTRFLQRHISELM